MIDLKLKVKMPKEEQRYYKHKDLLDKCIDYMLICESDEDSEYHFAYLKHVYKRLCCCRHFTEPLLNLLERLEEFFIKYDIDHKVLISDSMLKDRKDREDG